jgi:hypothetical protein
MDILTQLQMDKVYVLFWLMFWCLLKNENLTEII